MTTNNVTGIRGSETITIDQLAPKLVDHYTKLGVIVQNGSQFTFDKEVAADLDLGSDLNATYSNAREIGMVIVRNWYPHLFRAAA